MSPCITSQRRQILRIEQSGYADISTVRDIRFLLNDVLWDMRNRNKIKTLGTKF